MTDLFEDGRLGEEAEGRAGWASIQYAVFSFSVLNTEY
jgi:hypothetical protein